METQNGIDQFVLAGNNYLDSPHSQGGKKFATQISPLLNLKIEMSKTEKKEQQSGQKVKMSKHFFQCIKQVKLTSNQTVNTHILNMQGVVSFSLTQISNDIIENNCILG